MIRLPLAAAALVLALARPAAADVVAEGLWARPTPPNATTAAVYGTLVNRGEAEVVVKGAETRVAAEASLHETVVENDVASMRPVGELRIPPGGSVVLAPGGMHLMLTGLSEALRRDATFRLTFLLGTGSASGEVTVTNRAPATDAGAGHAGHGGG